MTVLGDDDLITADGRDFAGFFRHQNGTGIAGDAFLHARRDERRLGHEERHGLALHVGTHQGAVRVIVFKERNERRGDGNKLLRRHVHEVNFRRLHVNEFAALTANDTLVGEQTFVVHHRIRLRHDELFFAVGSQVFNFFRDATVLDFAIRRFKETEFVDARKCRERRDQTDVRSFRRFNRTNTSIVRRMNVADFKSSAITRQTPWPKRRQAAFMGQFGERINLIHELRQLAPAKEVANHG